MQARYPALYMYNTGVLNLPITLQDTSSAEELLKVAKTE